MKVALIAGTGGLPPVIAASLTAQGRAPVVCEMLGFASDIADGFVRVPFRIETLGTLLATLTTLDVTHICMVGAVSRPVVDPSAIDAATAPLVPTLIAAMAKGDDGTLRGIVSIFEGHGFDVVGAHQIAPELLPRTGVLTKAQPPDLSAAITAAQTALADMAARDLGQAVLVRDDTVIAREDARGTAAMLADHAAPLVDHAEPNDPISDVLGVFGDAINATADWLSGADDTPPIPGAGAVLYKAPKPGQIMIADMPMIGPDTAVQAAEAGLAGIVIPAGQVMMLDADQTIATLDSHGMFLWVTA